MAERTRELVKEVTAGIFLLCLILEAGAAAVFWLGPFSFGKTYIQIALGFLAGGILSAAVFWHMGATAEGILARGEQGAAVRSRVLSVLRTLAVFAAMALLYLTGWVSLLSLLAGMMTLKAAAYLQPFLHKILRKEERV